MTNNRTPIQQSAVPESHWRLAAKVAIGLIVVLILFDAYLIWRNHEHVDLEWHRAVAIHKGIEALALAAAGFLFGREINLERAEKAEHRAHDAEQRARTEQAE